MIQRQLICTALALLSLDVRAESFRTGGDARDFAAAHVGARYAMVARTAKECVDTQGHPELAKDFIAAWQNRNSKYYNAARDHLSMQLKRAEKTGGDAARMKVMDAYQAAVDEQGAALVTRLFKSGDKASMCKTMVDLVNSEGLDIKRQIPLYLDIETLFSATPSK